MCELKSRKITALVLTKKSGILKKLNKEEIERKGVKRNG